MTAARTAAASARAQRAPRANAWRMLRMQVRVEQLVFWRNLSTMFFTFVLPIVMLFVVAASNDPLEAVPLILALAILSTGFQGLAIQLVMHRDQGVLKRVMATPLQPWVLILGKALSTCIVIAIELVIMVAVGMLAFGAPFPEHPLALLVVLLLGTATFVALGFAMASVI
ncbi:MAG: ABC transporter permease, partial [Candidatus Cloacimonetes bacterium]|nr:ABC transporter permease [Candidatus Cloacimonadota bacterium]